MEKNNLCSLIVSAPGKVILHGEHSVVYGKTALAASLGLRSKVILNEHTRDPDKPTLKIDFPLVKLQCVLDLYSVKQNLFNIPGLNRSNMRIDTPELIDHCAFIQQIDDFLTVHETNFVQMATSQKNALRTFIYLFSAFMGITNTNLHSIDIFFNSELTIGAGTGSSASYSVCLAGALLQYVLLKTKEAIKNIGTTDTMRFSTEQQFLISSWAFNAERIMHGNPSGVDNTVCTFGSYVQFKKGDKPLLLNIPLNLRILLVDTKVPRETKTLVAKVADLRSRNQLVVDHILDACNAISTRAVEIITSVSKCNSVEMGELSLKTGFQHLEELWGINHSLLSAIGVSHPKLELARSLAADYNLACKLTGAGGGGYAIIMIPPYTSNTTVENLKKTLVNHDFSVKETKIAGEGVRLDQCLFT